MRRIGMAALALSLVLGADEARASAVSVTYSGVIESASLDAFPSIYDLDGQLSGKPFREDVDYSSGHGILTLTIPNYTVDDPSWGIYGHYDGGGTIFAETDLYDDFIPNKFGEIYLGAVFQYGVFRPDHTGTLTLLLQTSPVPLPAALPLFGIALLGLGGISRRRLRRDLVRPL